MRDMEGVNFAASQHVDIQDWRATKVLRDFFIEDFCNPFYERFLKLDIALGRTSISPADYLKEPWRFEEVEWVGAGKQSVNRLQDIQATTEAVKIGAMTLGDAVTTTLGRDLNDHLDLLQAEREDIERRGLEDIIPTANKAPAPAQNNTNNQDTANQDAPPADSFMNRF